MYSNIIHYTSKKINGKVEKNTQMYWLVIKKVLLFNYRVEKDTQNLKERRLHYATYSNK